MAHTILKIEPRDLVIYRLAGLYVVGSGASREPEPDASGNGKGGLYAYGDGYGNRVLGGGEGDSIEYRHCGDGYSFFFGNKYGDGFGEGITLVE